MNESVHLPPTSSLAIITLPHIRDRIQLLTKLKRAIRNTSAYTSVFVDADLTPAESLTQQQLRHQRNYLNNQRTTEETSQFIHVIRDDGIVQLPIRR